MNKALCVIALLVAVARGETIVGADASICPEKTSFNETLKACVDGAYQTLSCIPQTGCYVYGLGYVAVDPHFVYGETGPVDPSNFMANGGYTTDFCSYYQCQLVSHLQPQCYVEQPTCVTCQPVINPNPCQTCPNVVYPNYHNPGYPGLPYYG